MIEVIEVGADGTSHSTLIPYRDMFCDIYGSGPLEVVDVGGFHWFTPPSGGRLEIAAFLGVE
jgi:hypothetical protein